MAARADSGRFAGATLSCSHVYDCPSYLPRRVSPGVLVAL